MFPNGSMNEISLWLIHTTCFQIYLDPQKRWKIHLCVGKLILVDNLLEKTPFNDKFGWDWNSRGLVSLQVWYTGLQSLQILYANIFEIDVKQQTNKQSI